MISVLLLFEKYSKPGLFRKASINNREEYSVWIELPGTAEVADFDELLRHRGIRVLERVPFDEAEKCAEEIVLKFKAAGFESKMEILSNG
jgi:hypothetical protein